MMIPVVVVIIYFALRDGYELVLLLLSWSSSSFLRNTRPLICNFVPYCLSEEEEEVDEELPAKYHTLQPNCCQFFRHISNVDVILWFSSINTWTGRPNLYFVASDTLINFTPFLHSRPIASTARLDKSIERLTTFGMHKFNVVE